MFNFVDFASLLAIVDRCDSAMSFTFILLVFKQIVPRARVAAAVQIIFFIYCSKFCAHRGDYTSICGVVSIVGVGSG